MYKFGVLLTTYETTLAGAGLLIDIPFKIGVFDEHTDQKILFQRQVKFENIQNRTQNYITPLQNSVEQLFSQLNFMKPYRFFDKDVFLAEFSNLKNLKMFLNYKIYQSHYCYLRLKEDVEKQYPQRKKLLLKLNQYLYENDIIELEKNFWIFVRRIKKFKFGLDKAVIQKMKTNLLNKENDIEVYLRKNQKCYQRKEHMENDEDSIKFCEEDIDQILESRTQKQGQIKVQVLNHRINVLITWETWEKLNYSIKQILKKLMR